MLDKKRGKMKVMIIFKLVDSKKKKILKNVLARKTPESCIDCTPGIKKPFYDFLWN